MTKIEMDAPKIGKSVKKVREVGQLVKKIEMGDPKVGTVGEVWKIGETYRDGWSTSRTDDEEGGDEWCESWRIGEEDRDEPTVGKVRRSVRVGQEEYLKPEQDAMLAEASEEDGFIKCFDDITGKELPCQRP